MTNLDSILRSRDITLPTKVHLVKAMVFPVVTYGRESWTVKKAECPWCFWTVVLEETLESPLDCKEIQPVHPKGDQSWVFFGRTNAKAETPILWPPHAKSWLIGKDSDAGRDWGQENPRDRGACWAAVYGVAQSRTRLTRLSSSSLCNDVNWFLKTNLFLRIHIPILLGLFLWRIWTNTANQNGFW